MFSNPLRVVGKNNRGRSASGNSQSLLPKQAGHPGMHVQTLPFPTKCAVVELQTFWFFLR